MFPAEVADVLASGGQSGALIAGNDWGAGSLGPPERWPASVLHGLAFCITSRFPMVMFIGPELSFLYNDACLPILGNMHPASLGVPARNAWNDAWDTLGPMVDGAMGTGEAAYTDTRLLLVRAGFREECHLTFVCSVLRDEHGAVAALVSPLIDRTASVQQDRRLRTLERLSALQLGSSSSEQVAEAATRALEGDAADIPTARIYLTNGHPGRVHLAGAAPRAPFPEALAVDLRAPWRLAEVGAGQPALIADLTSAGVDGFTGPPGGPPTRAVVHAIHGPGASAPWGWLLVLIGSHSRWDAMFASFLSSACNRIGMALAAARSRESDGRRIDELTELDRAKSDLLATASHEIRTPLALLLGPVEDLIDKATPGTAEHETLEVVQRNALRIARRVDDLLDFSRLEAGRLQAQPVPTDISTFTANVAAGFRRACERAGIDLQADCPPPAIPVALDQDLWEKALMNLISNALKFTFEGSIRVSVRRDGEWAETRVADTGIGIPADEQTHLFERFYQVPGNRGRSQEGTGIGLWLARELVTLHGGSITVSSPPAGGTEFMIRVPVASAATLEPPSGSGAPVSPTSVRAAQVMADTAAWTSGLERRLATGEPDRSTGSGGSPDHDGATVLVVDDNADMREYLTHLLAPHWHVITASTGEEALTLLHRAQPDVLVTDLLIPGPSGLTLVRTVRQDPELAAIPVIMVSARAGTEAVVHAFAEGVDDYVTKPFTAAELTSRVRAHMARTRARLSPGALLTAVMADLPDPVYVKDVHGRFVYANDPAAQALGRRTALELVGEFDRDVLGSDAYPAAAAADRQVVETRQPLAFDQELSGVDGPRLYRVHKAPVHGSGASVTGILATLRDVTDERRAHERSQAGEELGAVLSAATRSPDVARTVIDWVWRYTGARRVSLWISDAGKVTGTSVVSTSRGRPEFLVLRDAPDPESPAGRAFAGPTPIEWQDEHSTGEAVPIHQHGRVLAVLDVMWDAPAVGPRVTPLLPEASDVIGASLVRSLRFDVEESIAESFQNTILHTVTAHPVFEISPGYWPAVDRMRVGGDWYDTVDLGPERLGIAVGDVIGHGIEAAASMSELRSALNAIAHVRDDPAEVLEGLDAFARGRPDALGATCVYAVWNRREGTFRYSSAGHVPLAVAHLGGTIELLQADRADVPLGLSAGRPRQSHDARLRRGDTVVGYTDGLVERAGESLDIGFARLCRNLAALHFMSGRRLASALAREQIEGSPRTDDLALLVVRERTRQAPLHRIVLADPRELRKERRALSEWLARGERNPEDVEGLVAAVHEALANAIEHPRPKPGSEAATLDAVDFGDEVIVVVRDPGPWRSPGGGDRERGRGLHLIGSLVDELEIERSPAPAAVDMDHFRGTSVRMVVRESRNAGRDADHDRG